MWGGQGGPRLGGWRRILNELEEHAKKRGVRDIHLETNASLIEAISLYRSAGYKEVAPFNSEPYAHHWFEKRIKT